MKKLLCFLMTMIIALSCSYSPFAAENLKFGDVNSDGKISSEDALLILEYATLIRDLDDEQKLLADVSDDGTINSYDALMVLEYSVGIINSFPAEKVEETLSVEEIVEIYNTAANKTKAYTGTMKLHAVQGASAKIVETSFPNAVVSMANGLLPNDYPTEKDYEITDGKDKASGDRIEDLLLPIEDSKKMSELKGLVEDNPQYNSNRIETGFQQMQNRIKESLSRSAGHGITATDEE